MPVGPIVALAVLAGSLAALVVQGIPVLYALQMPELRPGEPRWVRAPGHVSVVIAARDEAMDLPGCLDSLLRSTYPDFDVVVVDGNSRDGTREIARSRGPRVRVIDEPALPEGWVGKNWACHNGARSTAGEYLLFSDADVRHHPQALSVAVAWLRAEGADLVTLAPRVENVGFWERVVMPFYVQMVLTYFRTPRVNRDRSRAAMANGQYTLVRREAYEAVGGHVAIRSAVLEDVRLAQELRRAGRRLRVAWAPELLTTRMYRDRAEMFEGLLKNIHGTRFSAGRQATFLAGLVAAYWLPLGVLPLGIAAGEPWLVALGILLWALLFTKHVAFTHGVRSPAVYGLLYPLAVGFYLGLLARSIRDGLRHAPLRWKGRLYARET